jgi:hypothetical protein
MPEGATVNRRMEHPSAEARRVGGLRRMLNRLHTFIRPSRIDVTNRRFPEVYCERTSTRYGYGGGSDAEPDRSTKVKSDDHR